MYHAVMTLKEYMRINGLTQYRLAKDLDVSPNSVKNWLTGRTIPNKKLLDRIMKATDSAVQPNDFFEGAA